MYPAEADTRVIRKRKKINIKRRSLMHRGDYRSVDFKPNASAHTLYRGHNIYFFKYFWCTIVCYCSSIYK